MAFWNSRFPYTDFHELNLDWIIKKVQEGYTLPKATASVLGGIKVGSGLSVTSDGTLSATPIPACTGADGTYKLQATISSGTVTYQWVSDT